MPLWVILFLIFFALIFFRVPISIALGASAIICIAASGVPINVVGQRMFASLDSFGVMAIPFFVLAGNLMAAGGISKKLTTLASSVLGVMRGGLAIGGVVACGFFAALSGSAPATVIAIGSMLYDDMVDRGYPDYKVAGLFSVAGSLGPLIPPSIVMVMYGMITNTSIADMFIAGAGIGVILMLLLMGLVWFIANKEKWPREFEKIDFKTVKRAFFDSILALLMPIIVLGGIYGGIFTPTEAACVSVVYSFIVGVFVYKNIPLSGIVGVLRQSAIGAAIALFIMGTSSGFAWLFVYAGFTDMIVGGVAAMNLSPLVFLLIITFIILIFGMFMDGISIMILLMPIFQPVAVALAINPIHLAMVVSFSIVIGNVTPPVASNLYAATLVSKLPVERVIKGQTPFFVMLIAYVLVMVLFPQLSTFLVS